MREIPHSVSPERTVWVVAELLDPLELEPLELEPLELEPLELEPLEELPDEEPELLEPESLPGMVRRCPMRIMALEFRLLAEMIEDTDVPYRAARWLTVSPERTVWVVAELLDPLELEPLELDPLELEPLELEPLELEPLEELPDEEPELLEPESLPGMVRRCPMRIMALEFRLLAEMIEDTDVPYRAARWLTVSPERTVWVVAELLDPLELDPLELDPLEFEPAELEPLEELPDEEPELLEPESLPGMVRRCPMRIMALEFRLLAEMIEDTDESYWRASAQTESPERTVWVVPACEPDRELLEEEADLLELLELPPELAERELSELLSPICRTWPTRMKAEELRPFCSTILETVVP